MAVLDVHPHTIQYEERTEGYEDSNGYYHEGSSSWSSHEIKCKAVPNTGPAQEVRFDDGSIGKRSFTCYFGKQDHFFEFGERVLLRFKNGREIILRVAGYIPYELRDKLFLA